MLELCFNQSVRGALQVAQHCGDKPLLTGWGSTTVYVMIDEPGQESTSEEESEEILRREEPEEVSQEVEERYRRWEALRREAISLGGDLEDVLSLSLGLDMGDIRDPLGEIRYQLQRQWYEGENEIADRDWGRNLEAAERLQACTAGDTVRIWVDRTPHSACGLLHAASILERTEAAVHVVFLPHWLERPDGTVEVYDQGWGEVEPELFGHFLSHEMPVPPAALAAMARRWEELQRENAPLRAVVNGRVCSVGEEFYDSLIRRHLPEGRAKIGGIIGETLGRERPGIGDIWLAERIHWMLSTGELRMVQEDRERFYRSIVERA